MERKWYFQDEGVSLTATPGSSMDGASRTGQQVMMIVMMIDRWETEFFVLILLLYLCISVFVFLFLFTFYSYDPGCVSVLPWETRRRQKWHAFATNGKTWHETQLMRLYFCNCFVFGDWFISNILYFLFLAANGNSWHKTQFQSNCIFVICICWFCS